MYEQQTSLENYNYIQVKVGGRIIETLEILKKLCDRYGDATDYEITVKGGFWDPNRIRPRRYEAVKQGLINCIRKRRCTITGKNVYAWRISEEGIKELNKEKKDK